MEGTIDPRPGRTWESKGSHYVWTPSPDVIDRANVTRLMRRHGIAGYRELIARSTSDIVWFWNAVIEDLGISFSRPFDVTLDASRGIPWCRWFVGGSINLADHCLDRHARSSRRGHPAVIWEGEDRTVRRLSYGELDAASCRLAGALRKLGVKRGDRVGLFLPMVPEAVAAFFACAKIGAVGIPIFSGFGAPAVAARLNDSQAVVLVTADVTFRRGKAIPLEPVAREAAALCPSVRHVIVARSRHAAAETAHYAGHLDWEQLVANEPAECPTEPLDPESPLMIAYTSGTTGPPKGAVHVHGGFLVKIAQEVAHQVDMQPDDVLYWVTDLGWIMGPWELVGGLAAGGTVVLAEGVPDYPAPDRLWSLVERHGVTILGVSPTLVRSLARYGIEPVRSHGLTSLRILASTGETVGPRVLAVAVRERGPRAASDHQPHGRNRGRRLPAIRLADHAAQTNVRGRPGIGDVRGSVRRGRQAHALGRRRTGLHQAVARDDPRDLGRPRTLYHHVLVAMAGYLGPRRLGLDR